MKSGQSLMLYNVLREIFSSMDSISLMMYAIVMNFLRDIRRGESFRRKMKRRGPVTNEEDLIRENRASASREQASKSPPDSKMVLSWGGLPASLKPEHHPDSAKHRVRCQLPARIM